MFDRSPRAMCGSSLILGAGVSLGFERVVRH
jgi:hypothetical protein